MRWIYAWQFRWCVQANVLASSTAVSTLTALALRRFVHQIVTTGRTYSARDPVRCLCFNICIHFWKNQNIPLKWKRMAGYICTEKNAVQRWGSRYNATLWIADEKRRTSRSLLDRLGRFFPRTDGSHRQLMIAFRVGRLRHTLFLFSIEIVYGQKWFIRYFYIIKVPSECNRTKSVCGVFWQAINSKLQTKEVCLRHTTWITSEEDELVAPSCRWVISRHSSLHLFTPCWPGGWAAIFTATSEGAQATCVMR